MQVLFSIVAIITQQVFGNKTTITMACERSNSIRIRVVKFLRSGEIVLRNCACIDAKPVPRAYVQNLATTPLPRNGIWKAMEWKIVTVLVFVQVLVSRAASLSQTECYSLQHNNLNAAACARLNVSLNPLCSQVSRFCLAYDSTRCMNQTCRIKY